MLAGGMLYTLQVLLLYGGSHHATHMSIPHVMQVLYLGHEDLANAAKLEKGSRSGCIAHMAEYAGQGGCRRRKVLAYFGERRWVCVLDSVALSPQ